MRPLHVPLSVVGVLRKVRPGVSSRLMFALGSGVTLALVWLVSEGPWGHHHWVQVGPKAYLACLVAGWETQRFALDHPEQLAECAPDL